jgi:hypothetical protein
VVVENAEEEEREPAPRLRQPRRSSGGQSHGSEDAAKESAQSLLKELTSALVGVNRKTPRIGVPDWPCFEDNHRSFHAFREKLTAYIHDYAQGVQARTLAETVKKKCLTQQTKEMVLHEDMVEGTLNNLSVLYGRPAKLIEQLMTGLMSIKLPEKSDWPALMKFLYCSQ